MKEHYINSDLNEKIIELYSSKNNDEKIYVKKKDLLSNIILKKPAELKALIVVPKTSFSQCLTDEVNNSFLDSYVRDGVIVIDRSIGNLQGSASVPRAPKPVTPAKPTRINPEITPEDIAKYKQKPKPKKSLNPEITEEDRKNWEAMQNANNQGQNNQA